MPSKKILGLIIIIAIVIILIITLGLVFGLRKSKEDEVEIVNSYDNTEELIKKFPVEHSITVQEGLEKRIQNRLLTGFENWNRGYDAWKKWGDILYTNASIYNVNGVRMTLAQYQQAMDVSLKRNPIKLGQFHNMLINGNYTAIFYDDIHISGEKEIPGTVMEFVCFKEYGEELGTRVVVGWGGTKGDSFNGMRSFQNEQEKMVQDESIHLLMNYQIPSSGTLREKYPILNPTEYLDKEKADKFIDIILEGFDKWNTDINNTYLNWVDETYTADAVSYGIGGEERNVKTYKDAIKTLTDGKKIYKLYADNILVRDDWAAIHYRYRTENLATKEKYVGDRMQFIKFKQDGNTYKVEKSWTK